MRNKIKNRKENRVGWAVDNLMFFLLQDRVEDLEEKVENLEEKIKRLLE